MFRSTGGRRTKSRDQSGKGKDQAERTEDEGTGGSDVHDHSIGPAWDHLPWKDPQADTKRMSAAAGIPG